MNKVFPIKDGKKLNEIISGLADYQTDHERRIYLLFMVGICTGLRIGDIIGSTVGQVNHGDKIRLEEQKTGKAQTIKINQKFPKNKRFRTTSALSLSSVAPRLPTLAVMEENS